jgi:hypothetical protein
MTITRDDLVQYMQKLGELRPVFHSEADFQNELAFMMKSDNHTVRLEKPFVLVGGNLPKTEKNEPLTCVLDMEVDGEVAIELKYKKQALNCNLKNEQFALKKDAAHNLGRYDAYDDARMVKWLCQEKGNRINKGFTIFLTNDPLYWENDGAKTMAREFSLKDGTKIQKGRNLNWDVENPSAGSLAKHRLPPFSPINIEFNDAIKWIDYNNLCISAKYEIFKFFVLDVNH